MGLTAEEVSKQFKITREEQDQFSYESHMKAAAAWKEGKFKDEVVPITVKEVYVDESMKKKTREFSFSVLALSPRIGLTKRPSHYSGSILNPL